MENRVHIEPAGLGAEERQTSAEGSGAFTPGPWATRVIPVSCGLEETGYAHQVLIGAQYFTVAYRHHQNYERIHTEPIDLGYVRRTGIGKREPDLTPHPDARLIAAAPELYEALAGFVREAQRQGLNLGPLVADGLAALAKASPAHASRSDVTASEGEVSPGTNS